MTITRSTDSHETALIIFTIFKKSWTLRFTVWLALHFLFFLFLLLFVINEVLDDFIFIRL